MALAGSAVWIPDEKYAYVPGTVVSTKGDKVTVAFAAEATPADPKKTEFPSGDVELRDINPVNAVSEMDKMDILNKASVLENVDALFQAQQNEKPGMGKSTIYSSVGPVLIALNPFQYLPIYNEQWIKAYADAGGNAIASEKLGPHAFRSAEEAYQGLRRQRIQSVVICGESGAGKTVTNRKMLEYLCARAKKEVPPAVMGSMRPGAAVGANPAQVTMANELLEAFGNATTQRNDNSSRFGKLTTLALDSTEYAVTGCGVRHYLLERSRILGCPEKERNYHVFYQLVRGKDAAKYKLKSDPLQYTTTKIGSELKQPGIFDKPDDAGDYDGLIERFTQSGFTPDQQTEILEAMAAVIHIGHTKTTGDKESASIAAQESLTDACALLGVDPAKFTEAVTTKHIKLPSGVTVTPLGQVPAAAQVGAIGKMVYSRTFDFIVTTVDNILTRGAGGGAQGCMIGLLDIFGFEDMAVNGFEQMFINLTNERIQHLFNTIMFGREKIIYEDEGIDASFLQAPQNIKCVELFTNPKGRNPGLINLLNDAIRSGQDDEKVDGAKFAGVCWTAFKTHPYFKVPSPQDVGKVCKAKGVARLDHRECFMVNHYAGEILYTVQEFIPKSRDSLGDHLALLMRNSTKPFISSLFPEEDAGSKATVGSKFREQLELLATTLSAGETLFVRCIKSNSRKVPNMLERPMVMEQLVRGGVISALEMRAAGLPARMDYKDFVFEFGLMELGNAKGRTPEQRARAILNDIIGKEAEADHLYAFGHTRVFMKTAIMAFLRSAVRFKTSVYARRMLRMFTSARVKKIDFAWAGFQEAVELAKGRGLDRAKSVQDAIAKAQGILEPIAKACEAAKEKHKAPAGQTPNYDAIVAEMEPHKDNMKKMRSTLDDVQAAVEKANKRKTEFEAAFSHKVRKGIEDLISMLDSLAAVEKDVADMADTAEKADVDQCNASCAETRAKIEGLQTGVLPDIQKKGPGQADLDSSGAIGDVCPEMTGMLAEAQGALAKTEELALVVLKVRREFMKAIEELDPVRTANREKMDQLDEPARRCNAEGMTNIAELIEKAVSIDDKCDKLLTASRDPDGFRAAVAEYTAAVAAAEAAVAEGKEELARRERERAQRQQLLSSLGEAGESLDEGSKVLSKVTMQGEKVLADGKLIQELSMAIPACRQESQSGALAEWQAKVEKLCEQCDQAVSNLHLHIREENDARRAEFGAKINKWGPLVHAKAPAQQKEEKIQKKDEDMDAEEFIEAKGLADNMGVLKQLDSTIKSLRETSLSKSDVRMCTSQFMNKHYKFNPAAR